MSTAIRSATAIATTVCHIVSIVLRIFQFATKAKVFVRNRFRDVLTGTTAPTFFRFRTSRPLDNALQMDDMIAIVAGPNRMEWLNHFTAHQTFQSTRIDFTSQFLSLRIICCIYFDFRWHTFVAGITIRFEFIDSLRRLIVVSLLSAGFGVRIPQHLLIAIVIRTIFVSLVVIFICMIVSIGGVILRCCPSTTMTTAIVITFTPITSAVVTIRIRLILRGIPCIAIVVAVVVVALIACEWNESQKLVRHKSYSKRYLYLHVRGHFSLFWQHLLSLSMRLPVMMATNHWFECSAMLAVMHFDRRILSDYLYLTLIHRS